MLDRIKEHAEIYILGAIGTMAFAGFLAFMDARHEGIGEVKKSELRSLNREVLKLKDYQRLAPNSEYSTSRASAIERLETDIQEIEQELTK